MIAGYARVSTDGQSLEAQHSALQAAGAQRLYAEKISGAVTDRAALKRCLASLTPGDVVLVLGGLAEYERHLILARTDEGRKRAKARGVAFGPKFKLTPHQRQEALARRERPKPLLSFIFSKVRAEQELAPVD